MPHPKGATMIQLMKKKHIYQTDKRARLSFLAVLICCTLTAPAQNTFHGEDTSAVFSIRATHVLGFENVKNGRTGTLSIQYDLLQYQQNDETPVQVKIGSVRDMFLGEE